MKKRLLKTILCICMTLAMTQVVSAASLETETEEMLIEEVPSEVVETEAEDVQDVVPTDIDPTDAAPALGWHLVEENWKYSDGTDFVTGLATIGEDIYLFDTEGVLLVGVQPYEETLLYLNPEGTSPEEGLGKAVKAQWLQTEEGVYYFDETGAAASGWMTIDSADFYFNEETKLLSTGLVRVGSRDFYFSETGEIGQLGALAVGWKEANGETYYFKKTGAYGAKGAMLKKFQNIGGKRFYFDPETGAMQLGWQEIAGKTYYFKKSGALGVKGCSGKGTWSISGQKFYFDPTTGELQLGWKTIGKSTYYFKKTGEFGVKGKMLKGWQKISNQTYYFNADGKMKLGWLTVDDKMFYFKKTGDPGVKGKMFTGKCKVGTKYYYFNPSGKLGNKGKVLTGWRTINGTRYYCKKTGAVGVKGVMLTGWQKLSGTWYYFSSTGAMKTGWLKNGGKWYYLGSDGKMVTGWKYINVENARYSSYKFFFNSDGSLMQDVSSKIGRQSTYYTEVDRTNCTVVVYAKDSTGEFRIPVKTMTCSVGLPGTPTPTGTFQTRVKYRWRTLMGPSYGQYATRIVGGVLFHSVAGSAPNPYALPAAEYNRLGQPASHGCVRLCVRDAKWIYDNCPIGMTVKIGDNLYQPFDKPATIKIPASQNWDPTDPAV